MSHPSADPTPVPDPMDAVCQHLDQAVAWRAAGHLAPALHAAQQATAQCEAVQGPDYPDVANILSTLAGVHADQGDYGTAEPLYQRALAIVAPLPDLPVIAALRVQAWGDLGTLYRLQGRYTDAEALLQRALTLAESLPEPDPLTVTTCCNNLAVLYKYTGQFPQAARLYRRALRQTRRVLGAGHSDLATLSHNLGGLEHARGRYARGIPYARRSVALRTQGLGADHIHVAADVAALGVLLMAGEPVVDVRRYLVSMP